MADVKTDSLNTPSKSVPSATSVNKMTVEKQTTQTQQSATKNRTSQSKGSLSSEAPSVTPAQLRVASGNNSPASPKKIDPKGAPIVISQAASGGHPRSQQQQPGGKNKGNPWHKPSPPSAGSGPLKKTSTSPEGKAANEMPSSSVQVQDGGFSSKSISIPKDKVFPFVIQVLMKINDDEALLVLQVLMKWVC